MTDKKISQLDSAILPLAGTELVPIVQSGTTVKTTVQDLVTGPQGISGFSGYSGTSGFSGISGFSGPGMIYINTGANDLLETVLTVNELDYRLSSDGMPQIKANSETQGVVWSTIDNANTVLTAGTSLGLAEVETSSYSNLTDTALSFVGYSSVALITIPASGNGYRATFIRSVTASGDRGGIVVEQIFG
jgi:hypothetical protein